MYNEFCIQQFAQRQRRTSSTMFWIVFLFLRFVSSISFDHRKHRWHDERSFLVTSSRKDIVTSFVQRDMNQAKTIQSRLWPVCSCQYKWHIIFISNISIEHKMQHFALYLSIWTRFLTICAYDIGVSIPLLHCGAHTRFAFWSREMKGITAAVVIRSHSWYTI